MSASRSRWSRKTLPTKQRSSLLSPRATLRVSPNGYSSRYAASLSLSLSLSRVLIHFAACTTAARAIPGHCAERHAVLPASAKRHLDARDATDTRADAALGQQHYRRDPSHQAPGSAQGARDRHVAAGRRRHHARAARHQERTRATIARAALRVRRQGALAGADDRPRAREAREHHRAARGAVRRGWAAARAAAQ